MWRLHLHATLASRPHLQDASQPQNHHACAVALFSPPAAAQRYALVTQLLRSAGAKTVVDLGCGDGKLLQHLASDDAGSAAALEAVTGIDVSATALARGRCTLEVPLALRPLFCVFSFKFTGRTKQTRSFSSCMRP